MTSFNWFVSWLLRSVAKATVAGSRTRGAFGFGGGASGGGGGGGESGGDGVEECGAEVCGVGTGVGCLLGGILIITKRILVSAVIECKRHNAILNPMFFT